MANTFRELNQKPTVELDKLPEQVHCTVTGVSMRCRLHKWSESWELGNPDGLSCCLSAPQVSLENQLAQRTVSREVGLETGKLGNTHTKPVMKRKGLWFFLFSCISASISHKRERKRDMLLFVKKNGIKKALSKLAGCVNSSLDIDASVLGKGVHEQYW